MNNQEVFDFVVNHLRKQEKQSYSQTFGCCRYRMTDQDGTVLKCAVGCLIDDEKYRSDIEGRGVTFNSNKLKDMLIGEINDWSLLSSLQIVHDTNDVEYWEGEFEKVADAYGLIYTKV